MPSQITPSRRRAYESGYYQWGFQHIPLKVELNGVQVSNPARDSAVFVVHGMGQQTDVETAVQLRAGFEDAIHDVPREGASDVPTPYVFDGYWANYDDFEHTFPEEWARLAKQERRFFSEVWKKRSSSAWRAARWFAWQALRLVSVHDASGQTTLFRRFTYCWVTFLAWVGLAVMLLRYRAVLADVLGDVRLYESPRGEVQNVIVQRIERRIGEKFLLLLGLDWGLRTLVEERQLRICGQPHRFRYVTWVAHSLGSVISYNVISDLLERCEEVRKLVGDPNAALSPEERKELTENVGRVETGLHRFITMGSPLQKFAFLFPRVLRDWPTWYQQRMKKEGRHLWVNFFHIWDVVSGRLLDERFFPRVKNLHSRLRRVPLWAHVSYWRDKPILTYIVSRTYGKEILPVTINESNFLPPGRVGLYRALSLLVAVPILIALVAGIVYGLYWVLVNPDEVWKTAWRWIKNWLGIAN